MTTLYFASGTCALAPHVALEWIGAPYRAVPVVLGSPELVALNPAGAVPVLQEEDGWVLTQAGAILHYLARKHPEAKLGGGDDLRAEAELDRWSSFLTGDLHPAFYPVFLAHRYTTDVSDAARARVREAALTLVMKKLDILEDHLRGREWFLEGRSIVDAYALPMIRWARGTVAGGLGSWPAVGALHDRLAADPGVKRVLEVHKAAERPHH